MQLPVIASCDNLRALHRRSDEDMTDSDHWCIAHHRLAMEHADEAEQTDDRSRKRSALVNAMFEEAEAANLLPVSAESEPTRSVLYRSAAEIALSISLPKSCEHLANEGLSGSPPPEIAAELQDVLRRCEESKPTPPPTSVPVADPRDEGIES